MPPPQPPHRTVSDFITAPDDDAETAPWPVLAADFAQLAWPEDAATAVAQQNELRAHVSLTPSGAAPRVIAGIDVGYDPAHNLSRAAIVAMKYADLTPLESVVAFLPTDFPYIPGLLSFREIPVLLKALAQLKTEPDMLMVDGQGIAHPRRLGIAAHIGVLTGKPALGVAKSILTGRHEPVGPHKGDHSPLCHKGEQIGTVLRSRDHVKPLIISPGHRLDLEGAVHITQHCLTRYRLPEPTRLADKLSKRTAPLPAL